MTYVKPGNNNNGNLCLSLHGTGTFFFFDAYHTPYGGGIVDINEALNQFRKDPQLIEQITQSSSGKKLMHMLNQGEQWEATMQKAQQGDAQAAAELLKRVVANPDSRVLLERLSKELQK